MIKKINVIDLDKTLIPYDSFRGLVLMELRKMNIFLIWYTFLRLIRLNSMYMYKRKVCMFFEKNYSSSFFMNYALKLTKDIDEEVLEMVKNETNSNTTNILLSASPNIFVKYILESLKWEGSGSYFEDTGNFIHLYNKSKISWLKKNYEIDKYEYNFAISDSSSDYELLSLFEKKVKWE